MHSGLPLGLRMSATEDLLPKSDENSDEDDFSNDDLSDSACEEHPPDLWTTTPANPTNPEGVSIFFTNCQV